MANGLPNTAKGKVLVSNDSFGGSPPPVTEKYLTTIPYNETPGGAMTPPRDPQEFSEELDLLDSSGRNLRAK